MNDRRLNELAAKIFVIIAALCFCGNAVNLILYPILYFRVRFNLITAIFLEVTAAVQAFACFGVMTAKNIRVTNEAKETKKSEKKED